MSAFQVRKTSLKDKQEPCQITRSSSVRLLLALTTLSAIILGSVSCRLSQDRAVKYEQELRQEQGQAATKEQELNRQRAERLVTEELSLVYDSLQLKEVRLVKRHYEQIAQEEGLISEETKSFSHQAQRFKLRERSRWSSRGHWQSLGFYLLGALVIGLFIYKHLRK